MFRRGASAMAPTACFHRMNMLCYCRNNVVGASGGGGETGRRVIGGHPRPHFLGLICRGSVEFGRSRSNRSFVRGREGNMKTRVLRGLRGVGRRAERLSGSHLTEYLEQRL